MTAFSPIAKAIRATEQRSYTLAENALWAWRGMPHMLRRYGRGADTVAHGEPHYFATEATARDAGNRWVESGR